MILTIYGGKDKGDNDEPVRELSIESGEMIGIVGPTGSGKSTLISDIEQLAQSDTPSGRTIYIDGRIPEPLVRTDPRKKMVAQLSQNMHFLADMSVGDFLRMHAKSRGRPAELVPETIRLTNSLCGEPLKEEDDLTTLSGGQSRALMTADIALISDSPIVLIDEIENAGIKKQDALKMLSSEGKIVIVVTHDPTLALLTERRVVMRNGGMLRVIERSDRERCICDKLAEVDGRLLWIREEIRNGGVVEDLP